MNNIIFQAFRAGVIVSIAFFALANDVLAAPMLTPVTVTRVTDDSATIVGHVSNPQKNSTVWFEINNNYGALTAVAVQGIWNEGTFEWNLRDLNPGQTYMFRSVAMEGGNTVYSPISSFTTVVPKQTSATIAYQPSSQTVAQAPKTAEPKVIQATTQTTAPVKIVKETATTQQVVTEEVVSKDGFTNTNTSRSTATVIGSGSDIFPNTLIGWIMLLIAILIVVLVGRMIYESTEKRKKARDEDEEEDEDATIE